MDVQRGLVSLTGTTVTTTITLGTPVPVGSSFVISSLRDEFSSPQYCFVRVELITIVDDEYTQLRFTRGSWGWTGNEKKAQIEWQVISGPEFTVQSGLATMSDLTTTVNVTITAVDRNKAFIALSNHTSANISVAWRALVRARFTSDTNLELYREQGYSGWHVYIAWFVVEWDGATVQSGLVLNNGTINTDDIDAVDTAETFLLYNYTGGHVRAENSAVRGIINEHSAGLFRVEFYRYVAYEECYVSYFVVSHPNIFVQRGNLSMVGTGSATATLGTAVNIAKSFMPVPNVGNCYGTASLDNTLDRGWHTHKLWQDGALSKVTVARNDSVNNAYPHWQVVTSTGDGEGGGIKSAFMASKLVAAGMI